MSLTADQAYNLWKGTPYESQLMKHITYQPGDYMGDGYEQAPGGYAWNADGWYDANAGISNSQNNFMSYVRGNEQFKSLQAANPAASGLINYTEFKDDPYKITAKLTRAQYDQYMQDFAPLEQRMYQQTTYRDPGMVDRMIGDAIRPSSGSTSQTTNQNKGYVLTALDSANQQTARSFARYGLSLNAAQQQALERQQGLTRSLAVTDAANQIRRRLADRNDMIMAGATPNSGRAYLPAGAE